MIFVALEARKMPFFEFKNGNFFEKRQLFSKKLQKTFFFFLSFILTSMSFKMTGNTFFSKPSWGSIEYLGGLTFFKSEVEKLHSNFIVCLFSTKKSGKTTSDDLERRKTFFEKKTWGICLYTSQIYFCKFVLPNM